MHDSNQSLARDIVGIMSVNFTNHTAICRNARGWVESNLAVECPQLLNRRSGRQAKITRSFYDKKVVISRRTVVQTPLEAVKFSFIISIQYQVSHKNLLSTIIDSLIPCVYIYINDFARPLRVDWEL